MFLLKLSKMEKDVLGGENTTLKFVDVKDVGDVPIGFRYKVVILKK